MELNPLRRCQRGVVLLVSLIMLIVMTLLATSAIRMATVNLRTINNLQARAEAMTAAQAALDRVMDTNFTDNINGTQQTLSIAIDASKSYNVAIARPCIAQVNPIKNIDLDISKTEDQKCFDALSNPWSACSQTVWQVSATVNDGWFGANIGIVQGTGIKMDNGAATVYSNDAATRCPGT